MKKAIYKFLLSYYFEKGETLKTLQIAKNYYAGTRDNFDFEESIIPAEALLNTLAKMGQIEKIRDLAQEKTMKKILPAQLLLAYQSYGHLKAGDLNGLISFYEKVKPSLVKPVDPVILYNTAEAMFRLGRFQEAMSMYQEFISNYSYEFVAAEASLRIALCSDLLDRNYNDTLQLYKNAIDTSLSANINYEARIRYVAFRTIRKKVLDETDLETRIFLEQDKRTEGKEIDKNLQRLLQQVRLRTLIVDGKYKEALAYLSLIPMITMSKIEARSFDGDGAEIVFGLISDFYKKAEYTQAIKVWQNYKDKYLDKVAQDPYINFIVGKSYVKLGLFKGFDEIYSAFLKLKDEPNRTFPIWVNRDSSLKSTDLLAELAIVKDIKLKNWDLVSKNLDNFEKKIPNYNKINYYRGIVSFQQKNYKEATKELENFLSKETSKAIYDPQELADMIRAYTDSIYEMGQTDKFLKVSEAILSDTNTVGTKNAYILNVRERIAYLGIEITKSQSDKGNILALEKKVIEFKAQNPKSVYLGRVNLILGQAYIQSKKTKEGKELLGSLVNDTTVSDYIKELAKSELSLLNLKEQTL
jgi:TolA-binding protein